MHYSTTSSAKPLGFETYEEFDTKRVMMDTTQSVVLAATAITSFFISTAESRSTNILVSSICFAAVCFKLGLLYWQNQQAKSSKVQALPSKNPIPTLTPQKMLAIAGFQWALDLTSYVMTITQAIPFVGMGCAISVAAIEVLKAVYSWQKTKNALSKLEQSTGVSQQPAILQSHLQQTKVQVAAAAAMLAIAATVITCHPAAPIAALILCLAGIGLYVAKNLYCKQVSFNRTAQQQKRNATPNSLTQKRSPHCEYLSPPQKSISQDTQRHKILLSETANNKSLPCYEKTASHRFWMNQNSCHQDNVIINTQRSIAAAAAA